MFERHGSTHSCRSQTLGRYERKNAWCFAHYKMSFRLNVTGRGKLRRGQAHEDRPCRGLEDFVLRHRETVLRNKKERKKEKGELKSALKAGPPLDLSFWSFLTFLHHGIEKVERHLLWKFYKKIRRKSWSNVPPKLVACIGFLYKVVHKIGRLRKFNRSRGI